MEWIFFLAVLCFILTNILAYSWYYGITPTPTSSTVKKTVLTALPAKIEGKIIELGSGWGHLTVALAKHYPDKIIEAYEISLIPYLISGLIIKWMGLSRIRLIRKDFFTVSLADSSLIVCYLYPEAMKKLKVKFEKELKPGTLILTHTFAIQGWVPIKLCYAEDLYRTPVFVYQIQADEKEIKKEKPNSF